MSMHAATLRGVYHPAQTPKIHGKQGNADFGSTYCVQVWERGPEIPNHIDLRPFLLLATDERAPQFDRVIKVFAESDPRAAVAVALL